MRALPATPALPALIALPSLPAFPDPTTPPALATSQSSPAMNRQPLAVCTPRVYTACVRLATRSAMTAAFLAVLLLLLPPYPRSPFRLSLSNLRPRPPLPRRQSLPLARCAPVAPIASQRQPATTPPRPSRHSAVSDRDPVSVRQAVPHDQKRTPPHLKSFLETGLSPLDTFSSNS